MGVGEVFSHGCCNKLLITYRNIPRDGNVGLHCCSQLDDTQEERAVISQLRIQFDKLEFPQPDLI